MKRIYDTEHFDLRRKCSFCKRRRLCIGVSMIQAWLCRQCYNGC